GAQGGRAADGQVADVAQHASTGVERDAAAEGVVAGEHHRAGVGLGQLAGAADVARDGEVEAEGHAEAVGGTAQEHRAGEVDVAAGAGEGARSAGNDGGGVDEVQRVVQGDGVDQQVGHVGGAD